MTQTRSKSQTHYLIEQYASVFMDLAAAHNDEDYDADDIRPLHVHVGSLVSMALDAGLFAEHRSALEIEYQHGLRESESEGWRRLWLKLTDIVRLRRGLSILEGTFSENCQLVVNELEEKAQSLAGEQQEKQKPTKAETKQLIEDGQGETKTKPDERQRITLQQFFKDYCDLSKRIDIDSKREMLLREYRKKKIKLPLVGTKKRYRKGQTYLFWLDNLLKKWPEYRLNLTTLPPLKKSGDK